MVTDEIEVVIATGTFPSHMEAEEFLEVLSGAGYNKHLARPTKTTCEDGKHVIVLHVKKYAHFVMRASLDGDGPLEKWGDFFTFDQPLC